MRRGNLQPHLWLPVESGILYLRIMFFLKDQTPVPLPLRHVNAPSSFGSYQSDARIGLMTEILEGQVFFPAEVDTLRSEYENTNNCLKMTCSFMD